jgi:hypothetical protein
MMKCSKLLITFKLGVIVLAELSEAFVVPPRNHYLSFASPFRTKAAFLAENTPDLDNVANTESSDDSDTHNLSPNVAVRDELSNATESLMDLAMSSEEIDSTTDDKKEDHDKGTFAKSLSMTMTPQFALERLLQLAASTGRGEHQTSSQRSEATELIAVLEGSNPTLEPTNSPMINGRWQLLYSTTQLFRSSPFFMAGRAVCGTDDQATQYDWFCDMHRKALAVSNIGQVRQVISPTRIISEFEVEAGAVPFLNDFTPFSYSGGLPVSIDGAIVSTADITPTDDGTAWELFMDTVQIKGSNITGLRQILDGGLQLRSRQLGSFLEQNIGGYTNPRPIFRTTYLSETIRIGRDQDGKVFVYGKESDDTAPTDYSKIDSDLGLLKLLEGLNDAVIKFYI